MTPLTEQKSANLHDETTACDQVQHALFRAVVHKMSLILSGIAATCRVDTCEEGAVIFGKEHVT